MPLDDDIGLPAPPSDDPIDSDIGAGLGAEELIQGHNPLSGRPVSHIFAQKKAQLGNRRSRKIAGNTNLEELGEDTIVVNFYGTDIVRYKNNGEIVVNCAGYSNKPVTRERVNSALEGTSWQIAREGGKTIWWNMSTHEGTTRGSYIIPYTDGDKIKEDGTLVPRAQLEARRKRPIRRA